MDDKNFDEAWECWLDADLQKLDSSLLLSQTLWDDFTPNEEVAGSLFASVVADPPICARELLTSSDVYTKPLHSSGETELTTHFSTSVEEYIEQNCGTCNGENWGDPQASEPLSSSLPWLMQTNEESISSVDEAIEPSTESWMAGCFSDSDGSNVRDHGAPSNHFASRARDDALTETADKFANVRKRLKFKPLEEQLEKSQKSRLSTKARDKQPIRRTVIQPSISLTSETEEKFRSMSAVSAGSTHSFSSGIRDKARPVAYPFALLKPSEMQGDVTLKEINQRVNTLQPPKARGLVQCKDLSVSPFSGKSVVALTKIHTEGNGTITIMRTRST